jgi:molybdate-binding protein/DNA-binding XRE family transcriptional regulator
MPAIANSLEQLRRARGISAIRLAQAAGVSRQTIYAIEAGTYVPNTAVALSLARTLECKVEDLFTLPDAAPRSAIRSETAVLLSGEPEMQPGQPVRLCQVDRKLIASSPSPVPWYFPAGDAAIGERAAPDGKVPVRLFHEEDDRDAYRNRILIAGCDPGISVLARHAQAAGIELVLAHRNSSRSLELLKEGSVHIAGTHLRDEASGESNLPAIARLFARNSVAVVSFAVWEEGIVTARDNPKRIRGVEDLARKDIVFVNREKGSGSRSLLDSRLSKAGIEGGRVRGYANEAPGHIPAAFQVYSGAADCCIATRGAGRLFGLHFIPLLTERYDLAVRRRHLELPRIQNLFDTLSRSAFRRELEGLGGYDTQVTGNRLL